MKRFHITMLCAWTLILAISVAGTRLTSVHVQGGRSVAILGAIAAMGLFPIVAWLRAARRTYLLDSMLTLVWVFFAIYGTLFFVALACRLGASHPLRDKLFERIDAMCGVSVATIEDWTFARHLYGFFHSIYVGIGIAMWIAIVLPIVTSKIERVHGLLLAFVLTLPMAFPIIVYLPAIGPWYLHPEHADWGQHIITDELLRFRQPGPQEFIPTGIVAAPSYHVIWMVLFAWVLWDFKWLRLPVAIYTVLLILSTMTIGNHFFVDVVSGIAVSVVAIYLAKQIQDRFEMYSRQRHLSTERAN